MKLDNNDDYYRLTGRLIIVAFLFSIIIATTVIYDFFHDYLFHIPWWIYTIFFSLLFVAYTFVYIRKKYYFIIFDDEEENNFILLKYYPMFSISPRHQMLKIPKNALYKVEMQKAFFNLRDELILYQTINKNVAKYKPIFITSLKKNDKKTLIEALNSYAKVKMNKTIV